MLCSGCFNEVAESFCELIHQPRFCPPIYVRAEKSTGQHLIDALSFGRAVVVKQTRLANVDVE
jgi:hypothetical protein